MEKQFICFSTKLALFLRRRGFRITKSGINFKHPQYEVYFFEDSPELRKAVDEYSKK